MVDDLLVAEKVKFKNAIDNYEKLNFINNCIELQANSTTHNKSPMLYGDIREFIYYYVIASEEKAYGYYEINKEKIINKINLVEIKQQINLLNYFQRIIKQNGVERNYQWISKEIKRRKIKDYWANFSFRNSFKLIGHLSTYNILTLLISIFILYLIYSIILLPAPCKTMMLFDSKFVEYSDNKYSNHFLNTIVSFCNVDSEFKLNPRNWGGVILEILIKLSMFVLILGYLTEELKKKLL